MYRHLFAILSYLRTHDETSCAYVREHLPAIFQESIPCGDAVFTEDITRNTDWITADQIDGYLALAQEHKQHEIVLLLLNYKHDKLGFTEPWNGLRL